MQNNKEHYVSITAVELKYTTIQKSINLNEINTFIEEGCIRLIRTDNKDIISVKNILFKINVFSVELSNHQRIFYVIV